MEEVTIVDNRGICGVRVQNSRHAKADMERLVPLGCSFALGWATCHFLARRSPPLSLPATAKPQEGVPKVDMRDSSSVSTVEEEGEPSQALLYFRENPDDDIKMVFAVRNDLKMTKGKIGAQVGHAAVDCAMQVTYATCLRACHVMTAADTMHGATRLLRRSPSFLRSGRSVAAPKFA